MALKIRLARGGAKKRPFYHVVIADSRAPRDGRFVEKVGTYNPMLPNDSQDRIRLNVDRIKYWLSVGAQPTDRVALFLGKEKLAPMPTVTETPIKSAPKAKAQERAKALEEAKVAAVAEATKTPKEPEAKETEEHKEEKIAEKLVEAGAEVVREQSEEQAEEMAHRSPDAHPEPVSEPTIEPIPETPTSGTE
jgi:small subunit ribosomal protein S16